MVPCGCDFGFFTDSNLMVTAVMFIVAMIAFVGATNIYNFMGGINGITADTACRLWFRWC